MKEPGLEDKNLVFELAVVYSHFYPIFTCWHS